MALTTDDLQQITQITTQIFDQGFKELMLPALSELQEDLRDEMAEMKAELKADIKRLDGRIDEVVLNAHENHLETMTLLGKYHQDTASKKDHKALEVRVKRLELART